MKRSMPRGLPPCPKGQAVGTPAGLRFCRCRRCVLIRAIALRRVGADSDYPGATITRALTENA